MNHDTCRALDQYVDPKAAMPMLRPDDCILPRPIPTSQRLPKPYDSDMLGLQDCDQHGRCWWGWWSTPCAYMYWELESKSAWQAMPGRPPVCWLPHWALPLPEVEP
jgi:hypothetical protein